MTNKRLLLLSNSTNYGERFIGYSEAAIKDFLGTRVRRVLFVPFAAVMKSFDEYAAMTRARFEEFGYSLDSLHKAGDARAAVGAAEAIVIGGGNTFQLLRKLYESGIVEALRERVEAGTPYVGWSAGVNVACPTIRTTNDMPIVEPPTLDALGLVPFQINPHFTQARLEGHGGETREERLAEFLVANPGVHVVGLREGTMLRIEGAEITLIGAQPARVFVSGQTAADYGSRDSLEFLWR